MKWKNTATLAAAFLASTAAHAQSAGSNTAGIGWLHIAPLTSSDPLVAGGSAVPDTGATVDNADTLGLTFTHFFTDDIAVEAVGGIPPKFKFSGTGMLASSSINPLGDVRQWSPAVVLKYYFNHPESKWRPYVGIGVSYIWFTNAHVNPAFQQMLSLQMTQGATAGSPTSAHVESEWSPVFNAGLTYNFEKHWSIVASVSWLPFGTKVNLSTALPNGQTVHSEAKVKLDPLVTLVSVNYRF
ncbi:OmpW family protein [Burkholderia vietnamiensis]|uniref:OmpW/AlkL family protein n=1 Tax=Burkholderia vietnamiensis TaxID=60552 RepID=UPI001BA133E3|nr:OmpW family outer membrane protein [Burkholderia vietnamiensis]MBR8161936.1 OmpW family protein [Burkholderia vietnamiensis]